MPFINGERVTLRAWHDARNAESVSLAKALGVEEEKEPTEDKTEAPKPKRRRRGKQAEAQSAIAQITGLDIDLGDEAEDNE